jgi:hypothetical protein
VLWRSSLHLVRQVGLLSDVCDSHEGLVLTIFLFLEAKCLMLVQSESGVLLTTLRCHFMRKYIFNKL